MIRGKQLLLFGALISAGISQAYAIDAATFREDHTDFDGDRLADLVVWRPSNGTWYVLKSPNGFKEYFQVQWGQSGDTPIFSSDFDGDTLTDIAVWRPSNGTWYVLFSGNGYDKNHPFIRGWGQAGDIPIPDRDFDGDSLADLVVWRPSNGTWYVLESSSGYTTWFAKKWGVRGDFPRTP